MSKGIVSASVIAGHIEDLGSSPDTGHQLKMADGTLFIHIRPEIAAQWLPIIQHIAAKETK